MIELGKYDNKEWNLSNFWREKFRVLKNKILDGYIRLEWKKINWV